MNNGLMDIFVYVARMSKLKVVMGDWNYVVWRLRRVIVMRSTSEM